MHQQGWSRSLKFTSFMYAIEEKQDMLPEKHNWTIAVPKVTKKIKGVKHSSEITKLHIKYVVLFNIRQEILKMQQSEAFSA